MFVFHLGDNGLTLHNSWTGRTNHLLSFLSPFLHFYNSKGSVYACFLPQDFDFHFLLHFLSVLCLVWFSSSSLWLICFHPLLCFLSFTIWFIPSWFFNLVSLYDNIFFTLSRNISFTLNFVGDLYIRNTLLERIWMTTIGILSISVVMVTSSRCGWTIWPLKKVKYEGGSKVYGFALWFLSYN